MADIWPSYGLLVAQIWQTEGVRPNAIILHSMWAGAMLDLGQNSNYRGPDLDQFWFILNHWLACGPNLANRSGPP